MRQHFLYYLVLLTLLPYIAAYGPGRCGTDANYTLIREEDAISPQSGSATEFGTRIRIPWPQRWHQGRWRRVITYCFTDHHASDANYCALQHAIGRWQAMAHTGRFFRTTDFAFVETVDAAERIHFCRTGQNGLWNPSVPIHALEILIDDWLDSGGYSTSGFNHLEPTRAGRHHMSLPGDNGLSHEKRTDIITHELGHVFGMVHEFQRTDRDDHVHFNCRNLADYEEVFEEARRDHPDWTTEDLTERLCRDMQFAQFYDFSSSSYMILPRTGIINPIPFDMNSVMMYSSDLGSLEDCELFTEDCPLTRVVRHGVGNDSTVSYEWITAETWPSDGDVEFLQMWYPRVPPNLLPPPPPPQPPPPPPPAQGPST